ncbi:MAG: S8 family serine peptidase, partial [Chthoniobacteraceae bacterium]
MVPTTVPSFRAFLFAIFVTCFSLASVSAQEIYRVSDGGKVRDLVTAVGEIHVVKAGAAAPSLKTEIESRISGASVTEADKGRALVRVPPRGKATAARSAATMKASLPGTEVEAVLYPAGVKPDNLNRRIATADVLVRVPAGETAGGLAAGSGAIDSRPTAVAGHVMLHFPSGFHALDAARALQARGVSADVQLRRQRALRAAPNDVFFPNQWHLRNSGQGGGVVGIDANVIDAWDITTGAGVTINVVDECLQTTHPDLSPNTPPISSGWHHDFNGGDNDPAPQSTNRHGTSVGGVAAARGNNSSGVSGSAPDARLVGIRLIAGPSTDAEDASALYWTPPGLTVGVCNNSWGPTVYYAGADVLAKQALADAANFGRVGRGQITLFAGGNSQRAVDGSRDSNADSFANSRFVMAVGASNNFGEQCNYSQRGANLLVCAPSSDPFNPQLRLGIWTTDNTGSSGYNPGAGEPSLTVDPQQAYTNSFGGTSSATPLVAGCVALMIDANPNLGWRDVHEIVAATAAQLQPGDPDWVVNGGGFKFNHKFGGGMINATCAVVRGLDWDNLGPELTRTQTLSGLPAAIPDNSISGVARTFDFSSGQNLRIERAELVIKITHAHRSDLEITLTSPSGTRSIFSE